MPNHRAKDKYPNHKPDIEFIFDMDGKMNNHQIDATGDDIEEQLFGHSKSKISSHCLRNMSFE